jgi:hypothetical protein
VKHSRLEELRTRAKIRVKTAAKAGQKITLKQALETAAQKMGYGDWRSLKRDTEWMNSVYPAGFSRMLNLWFSSPSEARHHLKTHGGTLIPYGKHCFLCDQDYLNQLGLPADDPDLRAVGADWSRPSDPKAWQRLTARLLRRADGKG